jgi:hypothetical protein
MGTDFPQKAKEMETTRKRSPLKLNVTNMTRGTFVDDVVAALARAERGPRSRRSPGACWWEPKAAQRMEFREQSLQGCGGCAPSNFQSGRAASDQRGPNDRGCGSEPNVAHRRSGAVYSFVPVVSLVWFQMPSSQPYSCSTCTAVEEVEDAGRGCGVRTGGWPISPRTPGPVGPSTQTDSLRRVEYLIKRISIYTI